MSVWLPRRPPTLLARHVVVARQGTSVLRYQAYPSTRLLALRALNTSPPSPEPRNASTSARSTHNSSSPHHDGPTAEPKAPPPPPAPKEISTAQAPLATRIWKKVKHEAQHYWHGTKLLVSEVRISARLQWKLLHGESLTRRERRQVSLRSIGL